MLEDVVEGLIIAGLLAVAALVALIVRSLLLRGRAPAGEELLASSSVQSPTAGEAGDPGAADEAPATPPRQESEPQRLARVEKELAGRESKVKSERVRELAERERIIRMREDEEKRRQAAQAQTRKEPEPPVDQLKAERARITDMIKRTEERYSQGELEEKNFKRILSDYQGQIIDIDIRLRNRGVKPPA